MYVESGALAALALGFLLGLKHATDADHVVAVSTIVGEYRNVWRGVWIGGSWGLGHTTPLLVLGVIILRSGACSKATSRWPPCSSLGSE